MTENKKPSQVEEIQALFGNFPQTTDRQTALKQAETKVSKDAKSFHKLTPQQKKRQQQAIKEFAARKRNLANDTEKPGFLKDTNFCNGWGKSLANHPIINASQARGKAGKFETIITDKFTIEPEYNITDAMSQFINTLMVLWNNNTGYQNSPEISFNITDYMDLAGIKITDSSIKDTVKKIRKLVNELYGLSVKYVERRAKGRPRKGDTRIISDKSVNKSGTELMMTLAPKFYKAVTQDNVPLLLPLPLVLLKINTSQHKYAWRVGYALAVDKKRNAKNENRVRKIGSLLEEIDFTPYLNLKSPNRKRTSRSGLYDYVIKPFIKTLDYLSNSLDLFDYKILEDDREITNFKAMTLHELEECKLSVKWHTYPAQWLAKKNIEQPK